MNFAFLAGTILALAAGPLLYRGARSRPRVVKALDLFVMVSVTALIAFEVVPGTYSEGGAISLVFLLIGALGPSAMERLAGRLRREAHLAALWIALAGLVLHAFADGTGLAPSGTAAGHALGLAVVLHSIPVGLAVWWLVAPSLGAGWATAALAAMSVATVVGYVFATGLGELLGVQALAWVQATVAGFILHVVFGRPHLDAHAGHAHSPAGSTLEPGRREDAP